MSQARITSRLLPASQTTEADEKADTTTGFSIPSPITTPIQCVKRIGEGAFATVYQATYQGVTIAVKRLAFTDDDCRYANAVRVFQQEIKGLIAIQTYKLRCGIRYYGHRTTEMASSPLHEIYFEFVPGKNLEEVIRGYYQRRRIFKDKYKMPELTCADLTAKCLEAGTELASHHIAHGDLKPQNILLTETGEIKIVDWAFVQFLGNNERMTLPGLQGTLEYMAYELYNNAIISLQSEMFSWGGVMFTLAYGDSPSANVSDATMESRLQRHRHADIPKDKTDYGNKIRECWEIEPAKRPDIKSLYQHFALLRDRLEAEACKGVSRVSWGCCL